MKINTFKDLSEEDLKETITGTASLDEYGNPCGTKTVKRYQPTNRADGAIYDLKERRLIEPTPDGFDATDDHRLNWRENFATDGQQAGNLVPGAVVVHSEVNFDY